MFVVLLFACIFFYMSQLKMRDKMLCFFIRPNKQRIERWVPIYATHVTFDRGKYGKGDYVVDPDCITMMWYTRGINKFFPVLIPTLEFKWDCEYPLDPKTFVSSWRTPEARNAAWEEHQHVAYAKGTAMAVGKKGRFPEWLFPVVTAGLILIVLFVVWQGQSGLDQRMFDIEQQLKLLRP